MNVSFTLPLERSWTRMVRMLFKPFVLPHWMVLGFAAFLPGGLPHSAGGKYSSHGDHDHGRVVAPEGIHRIAEFLRHPIWGVRVIGVLPRAQ